MAVDLPATSVFPDAPPPSYVITEADRERWSLSGQIAERMWELYEDAPTDPEWVFQMQRFIYAQNDIPTGSGELSEEVYAPLDPDADEDHQRAWDMWADLERSKPGAGESDDAYWAHIARICDLFDEMFGNPDHIDLGPYDGAIAEGRLEEAFAHVYAGPYDAALHPKDRLGKWTKKLNGLQAAAADRTPAMRERMAGLAKERPALRAQVTAARAKAGHAVRVAHNEVVTDAVKGLAWAYSEHEPPPAPKLRHHVAGQAHAAISEPLQSAHAAHESFDRVSSMSELAHEGARWATEHQDELRMVAHVLAHAGSMIVQSELTDDDIAFGTALLESLNDDTAEFPPLPAPPAPAVIEEAEVEEASDAVTPQLEALTEAVAELAAREHKIQVDVHVPPAEVKVQNDIHVPAAEVNVEVQPTPVEVNVPAPPKRVVTETTVLRDEDGRASGSRSIEEAVEE